MEKYSSQHVQQHMVECQAYEEEFSYCAKYDEVCGVAIAPGVDISMYSKNSSDYFPITELDDY